MFYYYFRIFNWINIIFGLSKPFSYTNFKKTCTSVTILYNLWSLFIVTSVILAHLLLVDLTLKFDIKSNLDEISNINNILINAFVILIHMTNSDNLYIKIYDTINRILSDLKLSNRSIMLMSMKLYTWFSILCSVFIFCITMEFIFSNPPYVIIIRIPLFLSLYHLLVHLCLIISILKIINIEILEMLKRNNLIGCKIFSSKPLLKRINFFYFLDKDIHFVHSRPSESLLDLTFMCKIYDNLCTCMHLLQESHGLEILLTLWMMFTSAVTTITLISNEETQTPWIEVIKAVQVYVWFSICCYVDDQLRKEVEKTDLLIIKNMIDFRCDPVRKSQLQLFKQVVNSNRLQFTAGALYRLNYATVLGTVMSVITYSVISIQLF